jgi:hypothetical protein
VITIVNVDGSPEVGAVVGGVKTLAGAGATSTESIREA